MSERNIVLAQPRGFCAGVRRAIGIVERALDVHGAPVYVRKEIVHNHYIVSELQKRGAVFVDNEEEVPQGAVCVFSAHGVSPGVRSAAAGRQLEVIDATCPLVSKVHQEAVRFARDGRTILLVGHEGHEEVEGVLGEAPDRIVVIETEDDVRRLGLPDDTPVAVLTQTTLSFDETERVVEALRARFTDLITPGDDICYASQNRQNAVKDLARDNDLVLIVGSHNSSNSLRMVEVARDHGAAAHLVPDEQHLDVAWLKDVSSVGISAGASAPEILVDGLVARLAELGFDQVELQQGIAEDVVFSMPGRLADPVTGRVPQTPLAGEVSSTSGGVSPGTGGVSPSLGGVSPGSGGVLPGSGGVSPTGGGVSRTSGEVSPPPGGVSPSPGRVSPGPGGVLPGSGGVSPTGGGVSPPPGGVSPSSGGGSPTPGGVR